MQHHGALNCFLADLLIFAALLSASLAHADDEVLVVETRKTARGIPPKLLAMVQAEIKKGSFADAIDAWIVALAEQIG